MKKVILPFIAIFGLVFFISCEKEDNDQQNLKQEKISKIDVPKFKSGFPELYQKINRENIQKAEVDLKNTKSSEDKMLGITFPVMENGQVIGRYMGLEDESSAIYIDFSDYKNKIKVYDVNYPEQYKIVDMVYDETTDTYAPATGKYLYKNEHFWCDAKCTVGALVIAASDGPVPLMDVLAVAFQVTCMADCRS